MRNLYTLLALTTLITISLQSKATSINASGSITTATTWSADTVNITGNVTINNGITLTISSGTFVQVNGYYKIDVKGRVLAIGASNDSITFTPLNKTNRLVGH